MPIFRAHQLRMAIAGFACLAAMASAPLAVTSLGEHGIALPGLSSAQRLMAMLDARSPGERTKGELTQTKVRLAEVPRERALGKVFPPKPSPVEQLAQVVVPVPPAPTPLVPAAPPATVDVIAPANLLASLPLATGSAIIGGAVLPPPTVFTPPQPGVTSPVPEPGTWLTMLLGFGIIGSAMRRPPRAALAKA